MIELLIFDIGTTSFVSNFIKVGEAFFLSLYSHERNLIYHIDEENVCPPQLIIFKSR